MTIPFKTLANVAGQKHRPPLFSVWDAHSSVPPQTILITAQLLEKFAGHTEIDSWKLVEEAVKDTTGAVTTDFNVKALNSLNSLYYSSCEQAFHKHSDLANLYVKNRMTQYTLLHTVLKNTQAQDIKIKEINAGATFSRWQHFASFLPKERSMDVTIADLDEDIIQIEKIMQADLSRMKFKAERYDMREDFPTLGEKDKLDVMLVTYGFDSVWLDEDVMYMKHKEKWYQILYRVKVTSEANEQEELVQLLRRGFSEHPLTLAVFDDVVVETVAVPVEVDKLLFKKEILELYGTYEEARIVVPGTLVRRVKEAFETQLKQDGVFIIGEVATYPKKTDEKIEFTILDYHTTGKVAKYKVEDLYLAERILRDWGFKVEVHDLASLAKSFGKEISEDTEDTWVMVVKR
jgi:hypothetical protein